MIEKVGAALEAMHRIFGTTYYAVKLFDMVRSQGAGEWARRATIGCPDHVRDALHVLYELLMSLW